MNNPTSHLLASLLFFGTLTTSLHAQDPATGDPFVKDAAATKAKKNEPWQNVLVVLEVYALDKNDAVNVLEAERGGAARYRRVSDLSKAGKARLETLTATTAKSGVRAVTESWDLVRYATRFVPGSFKESPPMPAEWETRNTGETLEFEAIVDSARRVCNLNLIPYRVFLKEYRDLPGLVASDDLIPQPQFQSQRLTSSVVFRENDPFYLGTMTPVVPPGAGKGQSQSETWLAFLRVSFPGPTADELKLAARDGQNPTTPSALTQPGFASVSMEYSWYSLDRMQARDLLLASTALNAPWENLQTLLKQKKARFEHVATINTMSGQRALINEDDEMRYASKYRSEVRDAGREASATRQPGFAESYSTENIGNMVEMEPVLGPDGVTVDVNHVIRSTTYHGPLQVTGAAARYAAQPLFEKRQVTTSQNLMIGRQILVGTFNPPGVNGVNGRTDSGRTWFLFARVLNEP